MKTSHFNFPDQTIKEKDKDEAWHMDHIRNGWHPFYMSQNRMGYLSEVEELFNYYSCKIYPELEEKIRATITERYGSHLGPKYEIFPLIENKIEQISGTYRMRPVKRKTMVMNPTAINNKLDAKYDLMLEQLLRPINEEVGQVIGVTPETPNPNVEIPDDIEMEHKNYRSQSEKTSEDILYYLLTVRQEQRNIMKALKYYLITERFSAYIGEKDGHPTIIVNKPTNAEMDYSPNSDIQNDPNYYVYYDFYTYNELCNQFSLDEGQKKKLKEMELMFQSLPVEDRHYYKLEGNIFYYMVTTMVWKSTKTVKIKDFINKKSENLEVKLIPDENKDKRNVTKIELDNIRHVTTIGHDFCLSYGSEENQMSTISNPTKKIIPAVGIINEKSVTNGEIRSIAKKLMFIQDMMSEILYEIKIAIGQIDGNVVEYDSSSMPKEFLRNNSSMEDGLRKVNYYLKKEKMMITNRKDRRNNSYATSVNMGSNNRVKTLLDTFFVFDSIADRIIGLNESATGNMAGYEKATVAEMQRYQSTIRIEDTLGPFEEAVNAILQKLILKAKQLYKDKEIISYWAGESGQKFIEITEDFINEDIGIHIADMSIEIEQKRNVDEIASRAFINMGSPEMLLSLLQVVNSQSTTEAEAILRKGVKELQDIERERQERAEQMQTEHSKAIQAAEEAKERTADKQIAKDIAVANIYANSKLSETDAKAKADLLGKMGQVEGKLIDSIMRNIDTPQENPESQP